MIKDLKKEAEIKMKQRSYLEELFLLHEKYLEEYAEIGGSVDFWGNTRVEELRNKIFNLAHKLGKEERDREIEQEKLDEQKILLEVTKQITK